MGNKTMVELMISEAFIMIDDIIRKQKNNNILTQHHFINEFIDYCRRFSVFKYSATIEDFRGSVAEWSNTYNIFLTENELCCLGNLVPATSDEAKALITSLDRVDNEVLQQLLDEMNFFVKL